MCLDSILTKIGDFIFQNVKKEAITLFFLQFSWICDLEYVFSHI